MARFAITGLLRWSPEEDFYLITDEGERWLLGLPGLMIEAVDALLYQRVVVEGGRTGKTSIAVSKVSEDSSVLQEPIWLRDAAF